jgi:hypothetical protein
MTDNFDFTPGSGKTGAADDVGGVLYPRVKVTWGADGAANDADTASGKALPVQLRDSTGTEIVPLTTSDFDTKVGSLTETAPANDTASSGLNGRLQRIAQRITTLIGSTIAISAASLPLPTGAATETTLAGVLTTSDFDTKTGSLTETAPASDTASSGVNGRLQRIAQRITSLIALLPTSLGANGGLKIEGVASGTAVPVSIASVPSHAVTNAGTFAVQAAGDVAHDGADSGSPVKIGGRARSSEIAAVSSNDRSDLITDLVGKLIVLPYANPENFVSGVISTAMTGTTTTSLIAAPAAGLRNYITQITVSNSHATVGTDILIQDGSGGTTLYVIPAAAVYGGATLTFPTPLRQPTTATAIYAANVTTGSSIKISASGYKGA